MKVGGPWNDGPMSTSKNLAAATAVVAATGAAAFGWSLVEAHLFRLRHAEVAVLPPGQEPKRILHLSDLHMTPTQSDKKRWVAALARLEPDLVVATGDFLSHPKAVPAVMDALGPLFDAPGVFTLGSNDYLAPKPFNPMRYFRGPSRVDITRGGLPWPDLVAGLTRWGWVDLDNRRAQLDLPGWQVDSRGVDDPHIELDDYDLVAGDFDAGATLRLGVTHAPYRRVLDGMTRDGADLILAGHTHGGQVCVPGFGALVTNCDLDRKRVKGLSSYEALELSGTTVLNSPDVAWAPGDGRMSALHVSAGVGTSSYAPIRFACPPEATLLTLVARST